MKKPFRNLQTEQGESGQEVLEILLKQRVQLSYILKEITKYFKI